MTRRIIKINAEGSLAVVLPKAICQGLSWHQGMRINLKLGKDRTIIISEANDNPIEEQKV